MTAATLLLALLAVDIAQDWEVSPSVMPGYGALAAIAAGGGMLGRRG